MEEAHLFYSDKHKLHVYIFEALVLPILLCLSCSSHARELCFELEIKQSRKTFHISSSTNRGDGESLKDDDDGFEHFKDS